MKLHEKIKKIRLERGFTLKELRLKILNDFRENAVTERTLFRIEAGESKSTIVRGIKRCAVSASGTSRPSADSDRWNRSDWT